MRGPLSYFRRSSSTDWSFVSCTEDQKIQMIADLEKSCQVKAIDLKLKRESGRRMSQ